MESKQCNKCGEVKDLSFFNKGSTGKFGVQRTCRSCMKEYRQNNKEAIKERKRLTYQATKETRKKAIKRWKLENQDKVRAQNSKRLAEQSKRAVSWGNQQLIAAYYKEAKRLG